jgi:hypothetical protein
MTTLNISRILHRDETTALAETTHQGQAHFAGTGPFGATCIECKLWMFYDWHSAHGKHGGEPKDAPCAKYRQLMRKEGPKIPHAASACKYFEERDKPVPMRRPT